MFGKRLVRRSRKVNLVRQVLAIWVERFGAIDERDQRICKLRHDQGCCVPDGHKVLAFGGIGTRRWPKSTSTQR